MKKAAIFVDGSNMLYTQKDLGWYIDWLKLKNFFSEHYELISARYYVALRHNPTDEQRKFQQFLATNGFAITSKQLKEITDRSGGKVFKGNLDIELVVDCLTSIDQFDVAILLSGDGDFLPLIRALRSSGKQVKLYSTRGFSAIELVSELGMDYQDLNEIREQIEFEQKARPPVQSHQFLQEDIDEINNAHYDGYPKIGDVFIGKPSNIKNYGIFLNNPWDVKVLLHISQLGIDFYIEDLTALVHEEDHFMVEVIHVNEDREVTEVGVRLYDEDMMDVLAYRADTQYQAG